MRKLVLVLGLVLLLQLALVPASSAAPPPAAGFWHHVRHGETLFSIGRQYGVNAYSICHANGLRNCNHIYSGQSLWIPADLRPHPQPRPHPRPQPRHHSYPGCAAYHTIGWGQTLYSLGRHYGVNTWALAHANGIYNMNRIYAGQRLCIPDR